MKATTQLVNEVTDAMVDAGVTKFEDRAQAIAKAVVPIIEREVKEQETHDLAMHYAYRAEVVAEIAVHLSDEDGWDGIAKWCGGEIGSGPDGTDSGEYFSWITLPSGERAATGMWIVKRIDGTFAARYEVDEPDEETLPRRARELRAAGMLEAAEWARERFGGLGATIHGMLTMRARAIRDGEVL